MKSRFGLFGIFFFFTLFTFGQATITIEVFWQRWASENRVTFRDPSNVQIGASICDPSACFDGSGNTTYDNSGSPATYTGVAYGTGYSILLEDSYGDGWQGFATYVRVYQDGVLIVDSDLNSGSSAVVTFDIIAPAPSITIDDIDVDENAGTATFTATHIGVDASGPFTVDFQTVDGTAIAGNDFTATSGTLSFNGISGDTETITVPIDNDVTIENDETFTVSFTGTSDGTVDITDTATGTILDDDALIITDGVTTNTCNSTFFDSGGISGTYSDNEDITYTICPDTAGSFVELNFSTFDVEANFDFLYIYEGTTTGGTLIGQFDNNNSPTTITSTDISGCLTFRFTSDSSVTNAGWEATVSCSVPGPVISVNDISINEDVGTASFTVTHTSSNASGPFTVDFQTVDGTVIAGSDFTATSGTLSFNGTSGDTETITVPITDDGIAEQDETFSIQFTGSSDGTIDISDTATATINSQILTDVPLALMEQFDGYFDYAVTGNTLRTSDNNTDPCAVTTSSSNILVSTIPATATIERAYLYWAHSSEILDATVTFEGQSVTAGTIYQAGSPTNYGYVSDVTSIITGLADPSTNTYDFSDLTIDTSNTYCSSEGVLGGWVLMIFYEDASLPAVNINLYEGFERLRNDSTSFTLDSFYAIAGTGAKATFLSWEGDSTLSGTSESLSITNQASTTYTLTGDGGQTGNNAYNSTIHDNTQLPIYDDATPYGVDLDTYDISTYISPTDTQVTANVSVANDAIFSNVVILKVPSNLIRGTVYEDVNYPGGVGRDMATAAGVGIPDVTLELYDSTNSFVENTTTDANGNYTFGGIPDDTYYVRVVNSTVRSTRGGGSSCITCLPVQTYRNYDTGSGLVNVTNEVGGSNPASEDVGTGNLTGAQTVSEVYISSNGVVGLDFGFNFNAIVNTNEDGQGSLEQFMVNANNLDETGLDIEANSIFDPASGEDTSIFMIPSSSDPLGRTADSNYSGGYFDISISNGSPLSDITADNTVIDGRTQTAYTGDTNAGTIGAGGTTVGTLASTLPDFELPEIQVHRNNGDVFVAQGNNTFLRNLSIYADNNSGIRVDGGSVNIYENLIAVDAIGTNAGNIDYGIEHTAGSVNIVGNYIATATEAGILVDGGTSSVIQSNHLTNNGNGSCDDAITVTAGSGITITQNLIEASASTAIDNEGNLGSLTISENTMTTSGQDGGNCTGNVESMAIKLEGDDSFITNNIIFANGGSGLVVVGGTGNLISQNSFYGNGTISASLGIDLDGSTTAGDNITLNDMGDADSGPNNLNNFPIISAAYISGSNLVVRGWSLAGATLEFFFTDISEGTATVGDNQFGLTQDYGEGQTFIVSLVEGSGSDMDITSSLYADADGNTDTTNQFEFSIPIPSGTALGDYLTATATISNSTSEFSPSRQITAATVISNRGITYRVNPN